MKRILIITYYWPPAGGIAVQRWLKLVKYLPENNWHPIVVIPENPAYPIEQEDYLKDVSNQLEIIRVPIFEINRPPKNPGGKKTHLSLITNHKKSWKDSVKAWIRGNVILPDARVLWIRPLVRAVHSYLREHPVDVLVTNGPPHSLHLAGLRIKRKNPTIQWMADFRDPWTSINYYDELKPGWIANRLQEHWEKQVVQQADLVTTVSEAGTTEFLAYHPKSILTLSNGFDEEDFPSVTSYQPTDKTFYIRYIGSLMANQNYPVFWEVIQELYRENEAFKQYARLELVGNIDFSVREEIRKNELEPYTDYIGYVSAKEAIAYQQSAAMLLLFINRTGNSKGMMTGKLFGYLAVRRPILLIGPTDGNAAELIRYTDSGIAFDASHREEIKLYIISHFNQFLKGESLLAGNPERIKEFTRRKLTSLLASHLNKLTE